MPHLEPLSGGDSDAARKARGAFFTPPALARFVAGWAVRSVDDAVLEPSCGEAVFLTEIGAAPGGHRGPLVGWEVHPGSAARARELLAAEGVTARVETGDFLSVEPDPAYDAVVGNPPYVRYQQFTGEQRARAQAAALRAGVSLSGLASSWAAFTVHAALHLQPGGRLGLVLPAELLSVNYAAAVRRFLLQHFASVGLVLFEHRVFPEVQEEVLLLLAEGFDPTGQAGTDHCEVIQVADVDALDAGSVGRLWRPESPEAKWTPSLLSAGAWQAYSEALTAGEFGRLGDLGRTTLGMVTGNNRYFALSPARARELGLTRRDLTPLTPPGSAHLRGLAFDRAAWESLGRRGRPTWLFAPARRPSPAAAAYIDAGERSGVAHAYKCRVRSPWWQVPALAPADLLLTYMNADTPRLTANLARTPHLNSVHGVQLLDETRDLAELIPLAALNSVTLLGAETVGRAYGGGMLKLEPREADQLPMPSADTIRLRADSLRRVQVEVAGLLAARRLLEATTLVDEILLGADPVLPELRSARAALAARRQARGRSRPVTTPIAADDD